MRCSRCSLVREFAIVTSSAFALRALLKVTSLRLEGLRPLFAARIHIFSAPGWWSPRSTHPLSLRRGGGVVNVKTLIVMSCDTSEERRKAGRQGGTQIARHTAETRLPVCFLKVKTEEVVISQFEMRACLVFMQESLGHIR